MNYFITKRTPLLMDPFLDFFAPTFWEEEPVKSKALNMLTDVHHDEKDCYIDIDLPGIKKENIAVALKDGYLTVRVEVKGKETDDRYLRRERFMGTAQRSYYVGDLEEKDVKAKFEDGVLTLSFPKESQKKKEVEHLIEIK